MSKERWFVTEGIKMVELEEFLKQEFSRADYSHIEVQRTPLGTRVIIYANRPGVIIGKGGRKINEITEYLRDHFKLDSPQLDVKEVREADLDAQIVARQIASALERGLNSKRVANLTMKRIIDAGAVGAEIKIGGKLRGEKARREKYMAGYLQHTGDTAERLVQKGYAEAIVKLGKIGIQVRIMLVHPEVATKKKSHGEQQAPVAQDNEKEEIKAEEAEKKGAAEHAEEPVTSEIRENGAAQPDAGDEEGV